MNGFSILLDAPLEPAKRVQIAKLGDNFEHGKYGKFAITADDVETWRKNLAQLPGGRALIDADHQADRLPRNTEASGWITSVSLDGGTPTAEVEWTEKGKQAIADKRYLFISPTFGPFTDETGKLHDNTLFGASLTNRPFLNMPAITLASEERVSAALDEDPAARFYTRALDGELGAEIEALVLLDVPQAQREEAVAEKHALSDGSYPIQNVKQLRAAATLAASGHGDVAAARKLIARRAKDLGVELASLPGFAASAPGKRSDSRRLMDKGLLTALGLEQDTDLLTALDSVELDEAQAQKLLDAVTALKEKAEKPAEKPAETKTLEQQAAADGKVLLDSAQLTDLTRKATAGETALKQLHEQRFETTFEKALENPAGAKVTPAEKDQLHHFFTLDADATIKLIEEREPIVAAKPKGAAAIELDADADPADVQAAGLDPESHEVDRAIRAKLKELGKPLSEYPKLLEQYLSGGLEL